LLVVVAPAESAATTVASYRCEVLRVLAGTQAEPSSRIAPDTVLPLASRSSTVLIVPPVSFTPISALTGTPFLPLSGVIFSSTGPVGVCSAASDGAALPLGAPDGGPDCQEAGGALSSSPQADSASGVITATATIATRRLLSISSPFSRSAGTSCLIDARPQVVRTAGLGDG
jgi:hypothetical protein